MEKIRSLVRPVVTITGWLALIGFSIIDLEARKAFILAVGIVIGFWFNSRKN